MLDGTTNNTPKCRTKSWVKMMIGVECIVLVIKIKFKSTMTRLSLHDYSNV